MLTREVTSQHAGSFPFHVDPEHLLILGYGPNPICAFTHLFSSSHLSPTIVQIFGYRTSNHGETVGL